MTVTRQLIVKQYRTRSKNSSTLKFVTWKNSVQVDANRDEFPVSLILAIWLYLTDDNSVSCQSLYPWLYRCAPITWKIQAKFHVEGVQALYCPAYLHCTALRIAMNGYCIPVLPVISFLPAIDFFVNCQNPDFNVDMVASHCCSHNQLECGHLSKQCP